MAKLSSMELMETPEHMLRWLRRKKPTTIVTRDILDNDACLGANFCRAHGYTFSGNFDVLFPCNGWFASVVNSLPTDKSITARAAIRAILKVSR